MAKLPGAIGDVIDQLIHIRLRVERGQAWFNQLKTPFIIAASAGYILQTIGLENSIWYSTIIVVGILFVSWLIGHVDYKIGMWRRENEIRTREYNPYFEDLEATIKQK